MKNILNGEQAKRHKKTKIEEDKDRRRQMQKLQNGTSGKIKSFPSHFFVTYNYYPSDTFLFPLEYRLKEKHPVFPFLQLTVSCHQQSATLNSPLASEDSKTLRVQ